MKIQSFITEMPINNKPKANIRFNVKMDKLSLRRGTMQECLHLPLLFYYALGILATANTQKEIQFIQIGKEEIQLILFTDDLIICL